MEPGEIREAAWDIESDAPAIAGGKHARILPESSTRCDRVIALAAIDPNHGGADGDVDPPRLETVVEDLDSDDSRRRLRRRHGRIRRALPDDEPEGQQTKPQHEREMTNSHCLPPLQQRECNR